jgi:hypothetical protein
MRKPGCIVHLRQRSVISMRLSPGSRALTLSVLAIVCAQYEAGAQTQASFSEHTLYTDSGPMAIAAHGDFNNDGREDLIVTESQGANPAAEYLFLSNGDGTYDAPIKLSSLPATNYIVGDFNHDGNLDFGVLDVNSKYVEIWQGHGDGTFTNVVDLSTDQNPVAVVAADLNHDGCTDVIIVSSPGPNSTTIQTWQAHCAAAVSFDGGVFINSGIVAMPSYAFAGDFDGDGKPDLALLKSGSSSTAQVWYGDGKGGLGSPAQAVDSGTSGALVGDMATSVGDIDSNGTSDMLVTRDLTTGNQPAIGVFKGNTNRTLTFQTINTPSGQCPMYMQVADINGDGLNDLVYEEAACSSATSTKVAADLATAKGVFSSSEQTIRSNPYWSTGFTILKSTQGTKPDLAVFPNTSASQTGSFPASELVLMENTTSGTAFPGCGTTNQATGLNVCAPSGSSANSPVKFSVSASGPTPMRAVAVWVDGQKIVEQLTHAFSNYSFLDQSLTLSAGTHSITLFGTGWDDTLQQKSFSLTVGGGTGCGTPASPGVNVCKPANGSTVGSPTEVAAAATITGTLARMEVWVDGVKKFTETTSTSFDTNLSLPNGYHKIDVYAVNTAGTLWKTTVYATVGSSNGCAAPSSFGVNVCSPANGSTVHSPVTVTATANIPGTLARMEVWVGGGKKYSETTSTSFSTTVSLGAGTYEFDIYAVNTAGTKYETIVHATVQ